MATILEVQGRVRVRPERSGGGDRVPVQADRGRVVVEGPGAVLGHSSGETADELDRRQVRRRRTLRPEVMDDQQGQQNDRGNRRSPSPRPKPPGQLSGPVLHYPGMRNQLPLKQRVRLGEITDSSRAVADRGSRLDDRFEDGLTGLLTETLIGHVRRRYLSDLANNAVTSLTAADQTPSPRRRSCSRARTIISGAPAHANASSASEIEIRIRRHRRRRTNRCSSIPPSLRRAADSRRTWSLPG